MIKISGFDLFPDLHGIRYERGFRYIGMNLSINNGDNKQIYKIEVS